MEILWLVLVYFENEIRVSVVKNEEMLGISQRQKNRIYLYG